jgi:hypothetical protein
MNGTSRRLLVLAVTLVVALLVALTCGGPFGHGKPEVR